MGKASKALDAFINSIPDGKLTGLSPGAGTLHKDTDFRLDMQGMTSDKPPKYNLQVQINNQTSISTLKKLAPKTVAIYITPGTETAAQVRAGLLAGKQI